MNDSGILFDFDGTLVPNLDLADMRRQIAAMASAAGVPDAVHEDLYIVEIIEASRAGSWHKECRRFFVADRYAAASHQRIHDIEMEAAGKTRLFDQVRQVLAQLRSAGYKLGIVTRNCRDAVTMMFPDMEPIHRLSARSRRRRALKSQTPDT